MLEKREGPRGGRDHAERALEIELRHVRFARFFKLHENFLGKRRWCGHVHVRSPAEDPSMQYPVYAHFEAEANAAIPQLLDLL